MDPLPDIPNELVRSIGKIVYFRTSKWASQALQALRAVLKGGGKALSRARASSSLAVEGRRGGRLSAARLLGSCLLSPPPQC